jgi:hypothetical protein
MSKIPLAGIKITRSNIQGFGYKSLDGYLFIAEYEHKYITPYSNWSKSLNAFLKDARENGKGDPDTITRVGIYIDLERFIPPTPSQKIVYYKANSKTSTKATQKRTSSYEKMISGMYKDN